MRLGGRELPRTGGRAGLPVCPYASMQSVLFGAVFERFKKVNLKFIVPEKVPGVRILPAP